MSTFLGHKYFSAEKSRDPDSDRRPPSFRPLLGYKSRIEKRAINIAPFFAFVPRRGLEPPRISPLVPKTSAYTNSATWAIEIY